MRLRILPSVSLRASDSSRRSLQLDSWRETVTWRVGAITTGIAVLLIVSCCDYSNKHWVQGSIFCHVTDFSSETVYDAVPMATSAVNISDYMASGQPFVVSGVSGAWPATTKWSHAYFRRLFSGHTLFSSTFSTPEMPHFEDDDNPNKEVYYGIFLNNHSLATLVANDYQYPQFILARLRLHGNEWVHWGHPPCGAKRHMDITCTSRISVQVAGSKKWRLYPVANSSELVSAGLTHWSKTLRPLEVTLEAGDALVWFPGWEHETGIETGLSISLSLHFSSSASRHYLHTFSDLLRNRVSNTCDWSWNS